MKKRYYRDACAEDINIYIDEQMKDPAFKKEYDLSSPKYDIISLLIEARINEHLTQKELAKKCGVTQSNISRLESGTYSPTIRFLQKIVAGLGKSLVIKIV